MTSGNGSARSSQSGVVSPSNASTSAGTPTRPLSSSQKSVKSKIKPLKDSIGQRKPASLSEDSSARNITPGGTSREQRVPESLPKPKVPAAKKTILAQPEEKAKTDQKPADKLTALDAVFMLESRLAKKNINLKPEKPSPKEVLKIAANSVDLEVGKGQVPKSFNLESIVPEIADV